MQLASNKINVIPVYPVLAANKYQAWECWLQYVWNWSRAVDSIQYDLIVGNPWRVADICEYRGLRAIYIYIYNNDDACMNELLTK